MKFSWKWFLSGVAVPLIAAVIVGVIAIASATKPKIQIMADSNTYMISRELENTYSKVRQAESQQGINDAIAKSMVEAGITSKSSFDDILMSRIARDVSSAITTSWNAFSNSLTGYQSELTFYTFTITNRGSKVATNPSFQFPREGYFVLTSADGQPVDGAFSDSIRLPNIRPGISLNLRIWSKYDLSQYWSDACTINYDEGVASIRFPMKTYSRLAALLNAPAFWLPVTMMALLLLLLGFVIGNLIVPAIAARASKKPTGATRKAVRKGRRNAGS